jgi:outer membrane protein OmpA-like peptidoglycan-associated protein
MASKNEEEANYWPGYVDALTTMTMVLTFVMTILALAVFTLGENVSKAILTEILSEIDADAPENATSEVLKQVILERVEDPVSDELPPNTGEQPIGVDPPFTSQPNDPAEIDAARIDDIQEPAGRSDTSATPATLTVRYEGNEARLDEQTRAQVAEFLQSSEDIRNAQRLLVRGFASAEMGGITQSRRIAYYRAMLLRAELIANGIPAGRIQIDVVETRERSEAATAKVYTQNADR